MLQQGNQKAALKLLESVRREALSAEDVASLQDVLAAARVVHAHADQKHRNRAIRIMNAAQQNIRFLGRKQALAAGEEWVDPFGAPARPGPGQEPVDSKDLFGDSARPRSLALGLIASIASFPVIWGVLVFLYGMSVVITPQAEHVLVGIAAGLASLGLITATGGWVVSRRKVPVADRKPLAGLEGLIVAAVVIAAAAGAAVLGYVLWNVRD